MKVSIALALLLLTGALVAASAETGSAVVYCQHIGYPVGCVAGHAAAVVPNRNAHGIAPSIDDTKRGFILRQDLFDRNNPNNLRSDWPGPSAQPGQF